MRPLPAIIILMVLNHIAFGGGRVTLTLFAPESASERIDRGVAAGAICRAACICFRSQPGAGSTTLACTNRCWSGLVGVGISVLIPAIIPDWCPVFRCRHRRGHLHGGQCGGLPCGGELSAPG